MSSEQTSTRHRPLDLVCLSHLRWDFVLQRPQHLMSRFAKERRVFFVEEPVLGPGPNRMVVRESPEGVHVATPHLEVSAEKPLSATELENLQRGLLEELLETRDIHDFVLWYYTPMAMPFSRHLPARAVAYDCMDELSHFKNAPPEMLQWERALLARANVVFTGGHSLYQAKKHLHDNIHPFPSSVDVAHFGKGRGPGADPLDQAHLERPRLGFFGVIDERMNLELVDGIAEQRPEWQVVLVGPVMKISPEDLPRRPNITYLGSKKYEELPSYLRHWDVALMPFALNESTRFISPTKTPEYLAAGKPVVSTSIRDVVRPYGERGLVRIADSVDGFVSAIESSLRQPRGPWLSEVDAFLSSMSWDVTFSRMRQELDSVSAPRRARRTTHPETAAF